MEEPSLTADIELVGTFDKVQDVSIVFDIDGEEAARLQSKRGVAPLRWPERNSVGFHPSSMIKITLFRHGGILLRAPYQIGQCEGKVLALLLESNVTLYFMDDAGHNTLVGLKIKLSLTSKPTRDFMLSLNADVAKFKKNRMLISPSGLMKDAIVVPHTDGDVVVPGVHVEPLGQALQTFAKIMGRFAYSYPIVEISRTFLFSAYTTVKKNDKSNGVVISLAESLHEMIAAADEVPDLRVVESTTSAIEDIGHASLQVASLIHECTRLSIGKISEMTGDVKPRVNECQMNCRDLRDKFDQAVVTGIGQQLRGEVPLLQVGQGTLNLLTKDPLAQDVSAWLSAPDSSEHHHVAQNTRMKGTGSWVIGVKEFSEWKNTADSFVCILGKPGCGKTILCSSIISHLDGICDKKDSHAHAYFFFDGRNASSEFQRHDALVRSLVQQFLKKSKGIPSSLVELHGKGDRQPSTEDLEDALQHILCGFTEAYIVIDSLDECADRRDLLQWITKISRRNMGNLHLLVTTRKDKEIINNLQSLNPTSISMEEESENRDIRAYISSRLSSGRFRNWPRMSQLQVKDKLMENSQGIFRLVSLQLEELETFPAPREVKQQLERLPQDLDETYHHILIKIPEQDRSYAKALFQWTAFSLRPLSLEELVEAASFDFDLDHGSSYNPRWKRRGRSVFAACRGLLIESHGYVKFAHFSVKECLMSHRIMNEAPKYFGINETHSHSLIFHTCITYLLRSDSLDPFSPETFATFPLAKYAAQNWAVHARCGGGAREPLGEKHIMKFLRSGNLFDKWIKFWNPDDAKELGKTKDVDPPLYYASLLCFPEIMRQLSDKGDTKATGIDNSPDRGNVGHANALQETDHASTALQAASSSGHVEVVRLLLERGLDPNAGGGQLGTALLCACRGGHIEAVKLLLQHGAHVENEADAAGTVLQAASSGGHVEIVQVLLEHGVDINAAGGQFGTALQAACRGGHIETVKLLLQHGAHVDNEADVSGTVLQTASSCGHVGIVQMLLERGADIHAVGRKFGTALHAACQGGHIEVVKLLLQHSGDVDKETEVAGTVLQAASSGGHAEIVQVLLEQGADIHAVGRKFGTALHAASQEGHAAVVKVLLERGVEFLDNRGRYGDAFQAASLRGHMDVMKLLLQHVMGVNGDEDVSRVANQAASQEDQMAAVKVLLSRGVDTRRQVEWYGNAFRTASRKGHTVAMGFLLDHGAGVSREMLNNMLHVASQEGHSVECVKLLLDRGAEVNASRKRFGHPLQTAFAEGHRAIVNLLLERGAKVDANGGWYGNALQAASHGGHIAIVELLIHRGAIVTAEGGRYGNALQAASHRGHTEVMNLLLRHGADVGANGGAYCTALQAASFGGHEEAVELLLKRGAKIHARGGAYDNALQAASREGHAAVLKLLLEYDVKCDISKKMLSQAKQAASRGGHTEVLKLIELRVNAALDQ